MTGTVRVRWEGHPSPFDDPTIVRAIAEGRAPLPLVERLRRFEHQERISAVPGRSEFVIGPAHGFSRTYVWGPETFEQEMERADWELLRDNPWDGPMFREATPHPRWPLGRDGWRRLMEAFDRKPGPAAGRPR